MNLGRAGVLTAMVAASLGQASQPVSRVAPRRPPVVISDETGLVFRLSEGTGEVERRASPAPAVPLDADATQRVLDRLPPLAPVTSDQQPFAFRERSLPPPRTGATVVQAFPPPSSLSGPPTVAGEPVTVLRRSPEGAVPLASHLSVTFSQPMVPVGSRDDLAARDVPVRLTPQPPGQWRWVGTRTLLFEPTGRFPMATMYRVEVPAGVQPASGAPSRQAVQWEFTTPAPTLTVKHPDGAPARRDALMLAVFDQRIDPQAVLAHVRVTAGQGARDIRLATADEVQADEEVRRLTAQAGEGRWLAFRTREPLPPDTGVTVSVGAGTPSAEGPLTTAAPQSWGFRTFGPLRVTRHRCGWQEGVCPPGTPWQIELSNPIDAAAFRKEMVRVEPALPGIVVSVHGPTLVVQGRSKPRTTYRVTLDAALPDVFGQTLGAPATLTFAVGRAEPSLSAARGDMAVLDPAAGPRLSVYSTGLATLKVTVQRVTPQDWAGYRAFQQRAQRDRTLPVPPGTRVVSRTITVAGSTDELVETSIDLQAALTGGLGHAIVVVEPIGPPAGAPRWPGRVIQWVQATRIGLDAFVDASHLVAWATALDDGRPLAGTEVQLVPGGPRAETGSDGLATLPLGAASTALLARRGNDVALLPSRAGWWDQSGWRREPDVDQLRWLVFDDRGLYRPGEDAKVKGWVRLIGHGPTGDVEAAPAAVQSVEYVLKDSQGNQVAKGTAAVDAAGGFDLTLTLPATMNLGPALLELKTTAPGLGEVAHMHAVQVQEFRRPEFEVGAQAAPGPHFVGGEAQVTVRAAYFAGGVLPDAPVTWNVRATPGQFTPPGRDDFTFGTWVPWWRPWIGPASATRTETFESRTDASGEHHLKIAFDRVDPPQASQVEAEATVMDVNRQAWTSTARLLVHPADVYVGLRAPRLFVQQGERVFVESIVVDLDGRAVPGRPVAVTLERMAWEQVAGEWKEVPTDREDCPSTSGAEPTRCGFLPREGGSYRVTATVTDGQGRPNQSRIQLWVAGGAQPPRREVTQEEVTLVPAAKEYRPGQTAEVLVLAPFADAEGLLTLRRSGLVRTERFRIRGSSHTLRVPIEDAFVPNVHLQVDLVGSSPRTTDDGTVDPKLPKRPAFASGTIDLAVPPVQRTLAVSVAAREQALEPGGKTDLTLEVKDAAGRPVEGAQLAVVVVDEAVLALTSYKIPDPLEVFYAKREPGVADHHLRAHVLLGRPADMPALQEMLAVDAVGQSARNGVVGGVVGGLPAPPPAAPMARMKSAAMEEKAEAAPISVRADFRALALFVPAVRTDSAGRATVPVTVPESLTRYRVTAVAVSGARDFGKGESTVTARLPLMVRPSAPRFLNFGDRFELPVVVQNQTQSAMTVDVAVRAANAQLTQGAGRRVTVPAGDRVEILFPAATVMAGTARFQVGAASGRWADAAEVVLPVWTPATTEAFATYGQIDAGAVRQPIQTPRDVFRQFGGLEVTTSSTALSALTDAVLYLSAYPFECSEQLASRVLAVAALKDVLAAFQAKGLPPPAELAAAVDRDVTLLGRIQNDDGGFPFWRRGDPSWPYVSIHAAHALQRAKDKGFAVPEQTLARARDYLVNIERHIPREYGPAVRRTIVAYALHVRARMGDRDVARARALVREAGVETLAFEALGWILPLLSADPGSQAEAEQIVRHLTNRVTETAAAAHFAVSYGDQAYLILHSDRRADAVVLEGLIAARPQSDLIPKIVTGLLAHRRGGRWENTQENTFVLLALDRYFATYEKTTPDFAARLWLGDAYAGQHAFRGRTTERHQVEVPMAQLGEAGTTSDLVLAKEGSGRLYYRVGLRYAPSSLQLAAADQGFTVQRVYEAVDDPADVRREADGAWRIRAGSRVRVHLTMVAPARRYHVALVDPLPAGLEAQNPALATTGALPPAPVEEAPAARAWWWWARPWFEHQNLRDERVEAFTTLLWEGVHKYSYVARATTPGRFVVPPPKAEEMYHPETFGRGATDTVTIE
jgi:uncharacterized protein YfaS (alpha-2-macroglobulin family)